MSYAEMVLATVPAAPPARKNHRATSWPAPISAMVPYHRGSRLIRRAFCRVSAAASIDGSFPLGAAPCGRRERTSAVPAGTASTTLVRGMSTLTEAVDTAAARTYQVRTYGCQMNVHDSERLSGLLEAAGYVRAADDSGAAA